MHQLLLGISVQKYTNLIHIKYLSEFLLRRGNHQSYLSIYAEQTLNIYFNLIT
ncbi:hypothetical protein VISI1226_13266 [Vibrio sinaloensis DSM 21326]|uniref:Uncharacterized protein n=1 Tax=Vibrio sinaloensis DSM 21326 TaxID=945550 RepID=E8M3V2_PHOS4|nr:hypothetical protein VISI1226_13266 [Vibrio sinaloensis DSM 21326]